MVTLNYRVIESHPERNLNIKPIINKYNWNGIKYPSKTDNWKTFGKNNPTIDLNFYTLKIWKYVLLIFQKLIRILKNK